MSTQLVAPRSLGSSTSDARSRLVSFLTQRRRGCAEVAEKKWWDNCRNAIQNAGSAPLCYILPESPKPQWSSARASIQDPFSRTVRESTVVGSSKSSPRPLHKLCALCVKKLTRSTSTKTWSFRTAAALFILYFAFFISLLCVPQAASAADSASAIDAAQRRVVKVYGAGGASGLEAYQTGVLISPEGHVLTAWSYVLDTDTVAVVLHDGRRLEGKLVGADPKLELAVLKIDVRDVAYFDLAKSPALDKIDVGSRVLAVSNLYNVATGDEPASVQRGVVAAKASLAARRGAYRTPYTGSVLVIDAVTNNPGAAGGALVDSRGELLGVLGKELRSQETNAWLNYALPASEIRAAVAELAAGRGPRRSEEKTMRPEQPHTLAGLGLVLVPDALPKTPPYVDRVREGSPAAMAGVRPDDLVIMIDDQLAPSCLAVADGIGRIDRADKVKLTLMRGEELIEVTLEAGTTEGGR
jgi:S1-C subfamily serine protease